MRKATGVAATTMETRIELLLNGEPTQVERGATVAAALLNAGVACRVSESGEPRTAFCGMGVCFECRVTVDGVSHQLACRIECREGMTVETQR